jgi:hypothetical protein
VTFEARSIEGPDDRQIQKAVQYVH